MRTRRSNRTKRFGEKYDFGLGSDEEGEDEEPIPRAENKVDDDDDAEAYVLDESNASAQGDEDDDDGDGGNDGNSDDGASAASAAASDAEISESGALDQTSRKRAKRTKSSNAGATKSAVPQGYLSLEQATAEARLRPAYAGPFDRSARGEALLGAWYGSNKRALKIARRMLDRWFSWKLLPPKFVPDGQGHSSASIWVPEYFSKEEEQCLRWRERRKVDGPRTHAPKILTSDEAAPYKLQSDPLIALLGPDGETEVTFRPGDSYCLSQSNIPFDQDENDDKVSTGWILDTGGITLSMDWASRRQGSQLLAAAIIPHSNQDMYDYEAATAEPDFQKQGVVQLWEFDGKETSDSGLLRPSTQLPRRVRTLCFDGGQAKRVAWNPVGNLLAVICGDGMVYVLEIDSKDSSNGSYERIDEPSLVFGFADEKDVYSTAMTWVNFNRLAIGYADGSIALWSVYPRMLLSRQPVHRNMIVGMAAGYPTRPSLIASSPVAGPAKLIDLRAPSCETTLNQAHAVTTQPNHLAWSDELLGFFSMQPSSNPLNTGVGFSHHSHYPVFRRIFSGDRLVSCLAVGKTHPFLLIGGMDGSLWSLNPQPELFGKSRDLTERLRVLQHEYRPASSSTNDSRPAIRGVSRIVQGFLPEKNRVATISESKTPARGKGARKKPGPKSGGGDKEDLVGFLDPLRGLVQEAATRITAIEWNPNGRYGCWAAVSMASGLVGVMDLGLENTGDGEPR